MLRMNIFCVTVIMISLHKVTCSHIAYQMADNLVNSMHEEEEMLQELECINKHAQKSPDFG